jgi:hemerythrin-like domain-containing protein
MTAPEPAGDRPPADTPIQDFSNCHTGIVAQLDQLERLPGLLDAAAEARRTADAVLAFYRDVVLAHHTEEERDLFPAVAASAAPGTERDQVKALAQRLTQEHREVESAFARLEPALKAAARGHEAALDRAAVAALVDRYRAHARFEEAEYLPLAARILGRNPDHLAALAVALHVRHVAPEVLSRYASRI